MLYTYNLHRPIQGQSVGNNDAEYSIVYGPAVFPAAANTYTSYTTIISQVPFDSYGFTTIEQHYGLGNCQRTLYQVARGTAGAETNILTFGGYTASNDYEVSQALSSRFWPMFLPKDTRLSFRGKMDRLAGSGSYMRMAIEFYRRNPGVSQWIGSKQYTYGLTEASLVGTTLNINATANVWGSWTQLTAATSVAHKTLMASVFAPTNYPAIDSAHNIQLGVGAAGQEQIIGPTIRTKNLGYGPYTPAIQSTTIYRTVAAGQRLSARVMGNQNGLTAPNIFIHGIS